MFQIEKKNSLKSGTPPLKKKEQTNGLAPVNNQHSYRLTWFFNEEYVLCNIRTCINGVVFFYFSRERFILNPEPSIGIQRNISSFRQCFRKRMTEARSRQSLSRCLGCQNALKTANCFLFLSLTYQTDR